MNQVQTKRRKKQEEAEADAAAAAAAAAAKQRGRGAVGRSAASPSAFSPSSHRHNRNRSNKPSTLQLLLLLLLPLLAFIAILAFWSRFLPSSHSDSSDPHFSPYSNQVTYGSVVKLMHERTRYRLHSHDIPYGTGSGQQSVTAFGGVEDANSYWIVKEPKDSQILQGDPIPHGANLRFQHMRTRRWLHSHMHPSPITGNLEVSCFGGPQDSDSGDLWKLEIEGNGKTWMKDQRVRIQHVDTGTYLHSHDRKYSGTAAGQQEVCGVDRKTADSIWIAAEGIYLPVNEKET